MIASLLELRRRLGNLAGIGSGASEPVLYGEHRIGVRSPCGCVAYGGGYQRLETVFCCKHYRAWLVESAGIPHDRVSGGERRHTLRMPA